MAAAAAAAGEIDRLSSSSAAASTTTTKRSIDRTLSGGFVGDVLLWRNRTASICVAVGSTAFWILFNFAGYGVLSLVANTLLLLVSIIFLWAKSATLLNRPLPPIPNLEISNEVVGKATETVRVWINLALAVAREIGIGRDRKVFLQVIILLWVASFIGSLFSFFTLAYIGVMLAVTVPVLYDKYHNHVNEKIGVAHKMLVKHWDHFLSRSGSLKEKKAQ